MPMSPIEAGRFVKEMKLSFRRYVDDIWGPYLGPGGPRMGPAPIPWRELAIAWDLVKLADYLELAREGLGKEMVSRLADEPLDPCGTRVPGHPLPRHHGEGPPPPGEEPIISLSLLGAALIFVGEGAGSGEVKEAAVAAGQSILERA